MPPLTLSSITQFSKSSNLHSLTKLKCWGRQIDDISILQDNPLPNLQVLNLSVNNIQNLAPIKFCSSLQQLYLRCNKISDINEIFENLKGLKELSSLWVDNNPFLEVGTHTKTHPDQQAHQSQQHEASNSTSNSTPTPHNTNLIKILKNLPNLSRLNGKPRSFYLTLEQHQDVNNNNQCPQSLQSQTPDATAAQLKNVAMADQQNSSLPSIVKSSKSSPGGASSSSGTGSSSHYNLQIPKSSCTSNSNFNSSNSPQRYTSQEAGGLLEGPLGGPLGGPGHSATNGTIPFNNTLPLNRSNVLTASLALVPTLSKDELLTLKKAIEEQVAGLELSRLKALDFN